MSDPHDPEIVIRLPLSAWQAVFQHLGRGVFQDVAPIISAMTAQSISQTEAVAKALLAEAAKETPVDSTVSADCESLSTTIN